MKQSDPGKSPDPSALNCKLAEGCSRHRRRQQISIGLFQCTLSTKKTRKDKGKMAKGAAWGAFAAGENVLEGCLKQAVAHLIPAKQRDGVMRIWAENQTGM
jgi:hypothetical protein